MGNGSNMVWSCSFWRVITGEYSCINHVSTPINKRRLVWKEVPCLYNSTTRNTCTQHPSITIVAAYWVLRILILTLFGPVFVNVSSICMPTELHSPLFHLAKLLSPSISFFTVIFLPQFFSSLSVLPRRKERTIFAWWKPLGELVTISQ